MKGITRHPSGLYLLFTVEMWERFSYYGMRALLIFYLTKSFVDGGLGIDEKSASLIYGIFTGLVYFTPIIGGWLADRFLGQRLSIEIGAFTMMLGQFCLAAEQSTTTLFAGLTLLIIGNGFFKPNISVIVGQLYEPHDRRIDSAFTIFYMGINIGALFAPLVTGFLAETFCYRAGFMAAGIGLLLGLITYMALGNRLLGDHGKLIKNTGSAADESRKNAPLTKTEKDRTTSIFIITFFVIFFFAGFEQAGSSLSLYADKFIDRSIGSWEMPASWFQSINPLFIVLLAPLFSWLWKSLSLSGKEPSIVMKMGSGMVLLGVGFLFMVGAVSERGGSEDAAVKASIWWIVLTYLTHHRRAVPFAYRTEHGEPSGAGQTGFAADGRVADEQFLRQHTRRMGGVDGRRCGRAGDIRRHSLRLHILRRDNVRHQQEADKHDALGRSGIGKKAKKGRTHRSAFLYSKEH